MPVSSKLKQLEVLFYLPFTTTRIALNDARNVYRAI
jgi:hypothetical protein